MFKRLAILAALLHGFQVSASVVIIPDDYPTIRLGINSCADGDTVLVRPGVYEENINFNSHNVTVGSMFLITGDTTYIPSTIIDGGGYGSVVTIENGEDSTAVLTGFTLRNGWWGSGGGVHCYDSSPKILNNIITGNGSLMYGGGIYCVESNAVICGNIIAGNITNSGGHGGGIHILGVDVTPFIGNNFIYANSASYGAGIFCAHADPLIAGNIIAEDTAFFSGGGVQFWNSEALFVNNVIYGNVAFNSGGGIYFHTSDDHVTNTICWGDYAPGSFEIYCDDQSFPVISYCDIQDTVWAGAGNIDIDPLFRDPAAFDFHLMSVLCGDSADSPCIDSGDPSIYDSILNCARGLGTTISDMGAYGGGYMEPLGIKEVDLELPREISLYQNYPNPFNSNTVIGYRISSPGEVRLDIFNLLGAYIETIVKGTREEGYYSVTWNGEKYSTGVYFYGLSIDGNETSRKMTMIK
ncbi:MAG: T9SS type A sorting domain-containing protein [Candidatus Zixiibacteriota bacterium]|nr:MAG: T9SS type A sorting domain-containing protein [candidate division Zixibacteria bacterium]